MLTGQNTTIKFSLTPPEGVSYSSAVVTVQHSPWPSISEVTNNGDGTYSVTVNPDTDSRGSLLHLKVVAGGNEYLHAIRLDATSATLSTNKLVPATALAVAIGSAVGGKFNYCNASGTIIQESLLNAAYRNASTATGGTLSNLGYSPAEAGAVTLTALATATDYADVLFRFRYLSQNGVEYFPSSDAVAVSNTPTLTWVTATQTGVAGPTDLVFTLRWPSGAYVTDAVAGAAATGVNVTITSSFKVINAAIGQYAVTVNNLTAATYTVTPRYSCKGRAFVATAKQFSDVTPYFVITPTSGSFKLTRDAGNIMQPQKMPTLEVTIKTNRGVLVKGAAITGSNRTNIASDAYGRWIVPALTAKAGAGDGVYLLDLYLLSPEGGSSTGFPTNFTMTSTTLASGTGSFYILVY